MSAPKRNRQFAVQALLIAAAAVTAYAIRGFDAALAAAYGGGIVFVNTLLQVWHLRRAEKIAQDDIGRNMRIAMRCEMERLGATFALFALGFGLLSLEAFPLIAAFIFVLMATLPIGFKESYLRNSNGK